MNTRTGIVGLALLLGIASSGCAAVGASMHVSGSVDAGATAHAACEIGPGDVPTAVRWTPAERQQLESAARDGLVVISTDGCHVRLLSGCHARGAYTYTGVPLQTDRRELSAGAGLGASLRMLGSDLGGTTSSHYQLDVATTGIYRADRSLVRTDDLSGACAGANAVVASYDAGAFELSQSNGYKAQGSTGSMATAGLHGYSDADESTVTRGGQLAACSRPHSDAMPVTGCSAAVDVHLAWIAPALSPRPVAMRAPAPAPRPVAAPAPAPSPSAGPVASPYDQLVRSLRGFVPPGMLSSL